MPRKNRYDRPGRPVNHPPIMIIETGEVFDSYEDVAKAIGGRRSCVHSCLCGSGNRRTHMGFTFKFVKKL